VNRVMYQRRAMACVALLAGCISVPSYTRPIAPIPAQFDSVSTTAAEGGSAERSWREIVLDESLEQVVDRALANNRDLRVAALRVEQARAQYRISRAARLPSIDASTNATYSGRGGNSTEQYSASAGTAAYELDLFGRIRSLNRQALEQYLATAEAQRSAQIAIVAEVSSQYFAWQRARAQRALGLRTIMAVQESYRLTQALFNAGQSNELDVRAAEGQLRNVQVSVLNFEREAAQARNGLQLVVGASVDDAITSETAFSNVGVLAEIPAGLPSDLVQRRPDVLQAEHLLRAANANVSAARAAFFPSVRMTGSAGSQSDQLGSLLGGGSGIWSFVPQISVPIFRGGQLRAGLAAAQVGARIEVANYERTIQVAFREVSDALIARSNFAALSTELISLIAAQQRRFDLALLRFQAGEDAYLTVLTAQQDLYNAQQSLLNAQYNQLLGQLALYRALGGGWK
jgi:outer membrane protein, multidrug efflux system